MRFLIGLLALAAAVAVAAPPQSFEGAWAYISAKGHSERWLVVSSKKSQDEYFECENLDDVVRCVMPVWTRQIQQRGRFLPVGGRRTPYPVVEGSQLRQILDQAQIAKAQAIMKAQGLSPIFVYSQIKNEQMQVVGTQCDIRVVVPFSFKKFGEMSKAYLKDVYAVTDADGYAFETNN